MIDLYFMMIFLLTKLLRSKRINQEEGMETKRGGVDLTSIIERNA